MGTFASLSALAFASLAASAAFFLRCARNYELGKGWRDWGKESGGGGGKWSGNLGGRTPWWSIASDGQSQVMVNVIKLWCTRRHVCACCACAYVSASVCALPTFCRSLRVRMMACIWIAERLSCIFSLARAFRATWGTSMGHRE